MKAEIRFKNITPEELKEKLFDRYSYVIAYHRFKYGNDLLSYLWLGLKEKEKKKSIKEWEDTFDRNKK